jgi:hypothetical protein
VRGTTNENASRDGEARARHSIFATIVLAAHCMPSICRAGSSVKFSSILIAAQHIDTYGENAAAEAGFGGVGARQVPARWARVRDVI